MATYTALHIQSNDLVTIQKGLHDWLYAIHQADVSISRDKRFPNELYWDDFLLSEENPTMFALGNANDNWIVAHYNSFSEMDELAVNISLSLNTKAIVVIAQSVTEYYYISVYKKGNRQRALCWIGESGEWLKQEGEPLPFESVPLGRNLSEEGEEPFYIFERDEVSDYCLQLGLDLGWNSDEIDESNWTILKVKTDSSNLLKSLLKTWRK